MTNILQLDDKDFALHCALCVYSMYLTRPDYEDTTIRAEKIKTFRIAHQGCQWRLDHMSLTQQANVKAVGEGRRKA